MYFLIGADFVPTKTNIDFFSRGDSKSLFGPELCEILEGAEYRIFNLEVPLTDKSTPIAKHGPNLIAPESTVEGYVSAGVDLLCLANNHILDQGVRGLKSSMEALQRSGISYVGAGNNIEAACQPAFFNFGGHRIGVYACAEHEFSIADEKCPGANPFDPLWSLDHVEAVKKEADFVVVLYHGGKEYYRYPSPGLQRICRRLVDKGADLVICQHSHCIGCKEKYKAGTIVYGQGDFLFDCKNNEFRNTGLLISVSADLVIHYIPLIKNGYTVRKAGKDEGERILAGFLERSEEIKKESAVTEKYADFARNCREFYLDALSGKKNIFFRLLNRLSGGQYKRFCLSKAYEEKQMIRLRNYIECEAHRELLLAMIMH